MNRTRLLIALTAINVSTTLVVCLRHRPIARAGAVAPLANAAVVDLDAVFEGYRRTSDVTGTLAREAEAARERIQELERRYREVSDELELLRDPKPEEKLVEAYRLKLRLERATSEAGPDFLRRKVEYAREIHAEIERAVAQMARAHELDLVLPRKLRLELGANRSVEVPLVVFHTPELDITSEVMLRLNEAYRDR
jgi:Skp family chaperone for outer membrane proteins